MKPTKVWTLVSYAIGAAIFGFVLTQILVMRGLAVPVSPVNLPVTIASIALALAIFAIPMARYRAALKDPKRVAKRLAPLYAVRVVALAKASSIAGSMFLGWHAGVLITQLSLPAVSDNVLFTILGLLASLITTVVALVVENMFRVPPDLDEPAEGTPA